MRMRFVEGVRDLRHCTIYYNHYGEYFLLICCLIIYIIASNCICELFLHNFKNIKRLRYITESCMQSSSTHIYSNFPDFEELAPNAAMCILTVDYTFKKTSECRLNRLVLQFDRRSCTQMMVTHIQNAYNLCTPHTQFNTLVKSAFPITRYVNTMLV